MQAVAKPSGPRLPRGKPDGKRRSDRDIDFADGRSSLAFTVGLPTTISEKRHFGVLQVIRKGSNAGVPAWTTILRDLSGIFTPFPDRRDFVDQVDVFVGRRLGGVRTDVKIHVRQFTVEPLFAP